MLIMFVVHRHLLWGARPHRSCSPLLGARSKIVQKGFTNQNSWRLPYTQIRHPRLQANIMSVKTAALRNGRNIPRVGLGTWQATPEEMDAALQRALEAGYRHFDTAFNYNNEEAIGKTLRRWIDSGKIKREDLFITTKLPHIGNRASDVPKYLQKSLDRLQLDYVDLYLIHLPFGFLPDNSGEAPAINEEGNIVLDKETDHLAVWKAMEEQVEKGKVKSIGISNFNISQIQRIIENSCIPPAVLQIEVHGYFQQKELRKFCKEQEIIVTAYSPLGSPGARQHFQQKYNYSPSKFPDVLGNPMVNEMAEKYRKTPAQILLRHLVQGGIVVIPKSANQQRIKENIEVFDFDLGDEEMCQLDDLDKGDDGRIFDFYFWKGVENHPEYPFQLKNTS